MNLESYFEYSFQMIHNHKWSLTEIENMMPWEREIYIGLLMEHIKEENERIERENNKHG